MRKSNRIWLSLFFLVYAATFLPYFGIINDLVWVGPIPLPMAWVLFMNALNTVLVFVVYYKLFRPYARRVESGEVLDLVPTEGVKK